MLKEKANAPKDRREGQRAHDDGGHAAEVSGLSDVGNKGQVGEDHAKEHHLAIEGRGRLDDGRVPFYEHDHHCCHSQSD